MRKGWAIAAGLALAATSMTTPAALAQDGAPVDQQVELLSEMWAMAGICSQYGRYVVRTDDLADRLNDEIAAVDPDRQSAIINRKEDKLEEITATMNGLLEMPPGGRRERAIEENQMALMTRCQRLANHDLASEFFDSRI
ncbi:hypothetical protein [Aurantiacibacter gilvus]|uniref:Uncharacterized protein n=1 Tax=Aurantiacibacter gilvus TaxID=3139141 RepID=A0ABU9IE98_9SPHN